MDDFAIIIGAMKAGTTSLYEYLCQHPEIARCQLRKQVDFFLDDELWSRGLDWYEEQWSFDEGRHRWALEASPDYTRPDRAATVAERMASSGYDFRLIYLLRDPFDRICSHYYHSRQRDEIAATSVGRALRTEPALLDVSRYTRQLAEFDERFGRENVHLLTTERLAGEPDACLADICEFLGVDATFAFANTDKRYNSRDVQRQYGSTFSLLRAIKPLRAAVRRMIPLDVRNRMKSVFTSSSSDDVEYPTLGEDEKAYVREQLVEDLSPLLDDPRVTVDHWGLFDESTN